MNLLSKLDPRKLARFSGKEWLTEYATDDDEEDAVALSIHGAACRSSRCSARSWE